MPSLDQLRPAQRGRITALNGEDTLTQRLLEMGLLEGEEVEILNIAPLGDPVEVFISGYRLSLRCQEAARVQVTLLP